MNISIVFLTLCFAYSCGSRVEQCKMRTSQEAENINRILDNGIWHEKIELEPASSFDRIIQYHGNDSWGDFNQTIRLFQKNEQYVIEFIDDRRTNKSDTLNTVHKVIPLAKDQIQSIFSSADKLFCNEVNLETNAAIDGDWYDMQIKFGSKKQAIYWQRNIINEDPVNISILKDSLAEIVGELMRLSEFPIKKHIVRDENQQTQDSIEYDIFLAKEFNVLSYGIYYNHKEISKDQVGVASIKIPVSDTLDIAKKIIIRIKLFGKRVIDL